VESEETIASPEYLGGETSLPYTFKHTGEYEITETVTTDNLGTPTELAVRKVKATLPAITFKVEPKSALPGEGLLPGVGTVFQAKVADPNEAEPKLTLTWRFGDGSAPVIQNVTGKEGSFAASVEHAFSSTCGGTCAVTLEVKDADGAEGHGELKILMSTKREREAQENAEREAREAKERAEHEARETAEREAKEHEEKERHLVKGVEAFHNPEAKIAGSTSLSVSASGALILKVSCPPKESECVGTVTLQVVIAQGAKKGKKPKKVTVAVARGNFSIAGGATQTLTVHLSSQGRALLARDHVLHATALLVAHDSVVTRKTTASVTLRPAQKRKKK
jgi:hypothetical protein